MAAIDDYMGRVAELGCVVCWKRGFRDVPAELHHPRFAAGMGQRASDWLVIPVCPYCHRGSKGIHGDRTILRQLKCDEAELLAWTIARAFGGLK